MRFNKLNLNLLVALDALLTDRNISRAGERIHLSQPAMSNALAQLRNYFGDELLVPVGRQMELTPRAEVLKEAVRDVLVRIETTVAAQPEFDCQNTDRVFKLFVSDYTMEVLMPHAFAIADALGSKAQFQLSPQVANPARTLERGGADLLIIPAEFCSTDHPKQVLFDDDFVCVVWNQSSHARKGITKETYASAGHVVMQPIENPEPIFEKRIQDAAGFRRRVQVTSFSFAALPFLIVGTELVATLHEKQARLVEAAVPISRLTLPFAMPPIHQAMQWHKYRTLDPGLIWLRNLMAEAALRV